MAADEAVHMAALADAPYHSRRFFLRHKGRPHMLQGLDNARIECARSPTSSDADGLWETKPKHAVQRINGEGDLVGATLIRSRAQGSADHSFQPADG
jgi:hypothetical protein